MKAKHSREIVLEMKRSSIHYLNPFGLRTAALAGLTAAALFFTSCSSPEQIQRRKLKGVESRRDISLAYVGSCQIKTITDTCVDFYTNINTSMKKFALKNCAIIDGPCDRLSATTICLSPAQKGDALIQYEFIFPPTIETAVLDKECNPAQNRELVRL